MNFSHLIDDTLLDSIRTQETGDGSDLVNEKSGALGPYQFMPKTWAGLKREGKIPKDADIMNEKDARMGAKALLTDYLKMFKGDLELALASYNYGPGNVQDWLKQSSDKTFTGISQLKNFPKETRDYVPEVLARQKKNYGEDYPSDQTDSSLAAVGLYPGARRGGPSASAQAKGYRSTIEGNVALNAIPTSPRTTVATSPEAESDETEGLGILDFVSPNKAYADELPAGAKYNNQEQSAEQPAEQPVEQQEQTAASPEQTAEVAESAEAPEQDFSALPTQPFQGQGFLDDFKSRLFDYSTSKEWNDITPEQRINTVQAIYNSGSWHSEVRPHLKNTITNLWDTVAPENRPDFNALVNKFGGVPVLPDDTTDPKAALDQWHAELDQSMVLAGITPEIYGNQFDQFLGQAKENEITAFNNRQRGGFAQAARETAAMVGVGLRGAASAVSAIPASMARYQPLTWFSDEIKAIGESQAQAFEEAGRLLPELLFGNNPVTMKATDSFIDEALAATDEQGNPIISETGEAARKYPRLERFTDLFGNIAGMFAGGSAIKNGFSTMGAAEGVVANLGYNTAIGMNMAFHETKAEGGTDEQAWKAGVLSLPFSIAQAVATHSVLSGAPPIVLGLKPNEQAKNIAKWATTQLFLKEGPAMVVQQLGMSTAASTVLGRNVITADKLIDAYGAGVLGGAMGKIIDVKAGFKEKNLQERRLKALTDFANSGELQNVPNGGTEIKVPGPEKETLMVVRPLTKQEMGGLTRKLNAFRKSPANDVLDLTLEEASALPDYFLKHGGYRATPSQKIEKGITLTRVTDYVAKDGSTIESLDTAIGSVSKYLSDHPAEGSERAIQNEYFMLKQQFGEAVRLEAKSKHTDAKDFGTKLGQAIEKQRHLENDVRTAQEMYAQEVRAGRGGDKSEAFFMRSEAKEALRQHHEATAKVFGAWEKFSEMGTRMDRLKYWVDVIQNNEPGVLANNITAAEQNMQFLLDKKSALTKEAVASAEAADARVATQKITRELKVAKERRATMNEAGLSNLPSDVDLTRGVPVNGRVIMPYKGQWFVMDRAGYIAQQAYERFWDAAASTKLEGVYPTLEAINKKFPELKVMADADKLELMNQYRQDAKEVEDLLRGVTKQKVKKGGKRLERSEHVERELTRRFPETENLTFNEKLDHAVNWLERVKKVPLYEAPQVTRAAAMGSADQMITDLRNIDAQKVGQLIDRRDAILARLDSFPKDQHDSAQFNEVKQELRAVQQELDAVFKPAAKPDEPAMNKMASIASEDGPIAPDKFIQASREIEQAKATDAAKGDITWESTKRIIKSQNKEGPLDRNQWVNPADRHATTDPEKFDFQTVSDKKVPAGEVIKEVASLAHWLDKRVRVLFGGKMPDNATGYIHYLNSLIKVGRHEDIQPTVHEVVGHLVDATLVSRWNNQNRGNYDDLPIALHEALLDTAHTYYGNTNLTHNQRLKEGMAMFFQHYMTGQPVRRELLDWYESQFSTQHPEAFGRIESLKEKVYDYYKQKPELYVEGKIRKPEGKIEAALKKLTTPFLMDKFVDSRYVYREVEQYARSMREDIFGKSMELSVTDQAKAAEKIAKYFPGTDNLNPADRIEYAKKFFENLPQLHKESEVNAYRAEALANNIMRGQLGDWIGNTTMWGKDISQLMNITQIFDSLAKAKTSQFPKGKVEPFIAALTARRAATLFWKGVESSINYKDAMATLKTLNSDPDINRALNKYDEVVEVLQHMIAQSSPAGAYMVSKWHKENVDAIKGSELFGMFTRPGTGFWVPFQRSGYEQVKSYMKSKGSTLPPMDPRFTLEPAIRGLLKHAVRQADFYNVMRMLDVPGPNPIGGYIRDVTGEALTKLQAEAKSRGKNIHEEAYTGDRGEYQDGLTNFFQPWYDSPKGKQFKYFSMMDGQGKLRFFEVDPRVFKAVQGGLPEWVGNPVIKALWIAPGRVLRPMATTFQLAFQFKQLLRDPITAWRWLETSGIGAKDAVNLYKNIHASIVDQTLFHTTGKRDAGWFAHLSRMGVAHMTKVGIDRALFKETAGKMPGQILGRMETMMSLAEVVGSMPELATRSAVAKMVGEKLGMKDVNQQLTPLQAIEIMSAFQRGTTNFGRQGEWTRLINIGVPFFTARIAELTRLPEDAARSPYKFGAIAVGALALGVYHALAHNDKPWYKEADIATKMQNAWFETNAFGEPSRIIGLPLDSLTGLAWGIGQALGNVAGSDPNLSPGMVEAAKAYFGQNVSPLNNVEDLLGVLGKEWAAQRENKDYYFDRPIVPPNMTYKNPAEQYTEYTTELSKKVGKLMGWSPMRIDHAIRAAAPAAARALSWSEKLVGAKTDKDTSGSFLTDTLLGVIPTRYGTTANVMDRSSRLFYDKLIESRTNKAAETAEEAGIRKRLERINQNISYINTVLHAEFKQEDREALKKKKRELLNLGLDIARGEPARVPGSAEKSKALRIRREQTKQTQAQARADRGFSLSGSTVSGAAP